MNLLKPILFSAVQPSGTLTIGNYIGSILHWSSMQTTHHCIYSIADLHALTVFKNISSLQQSKLDTLCFYLSAGINPKQSIIFLQSQVHQHCQLNWILNCYTYFGELKRMVQFKQKSKIYAKNINSGLFNYPILMSSDILLYQSNVVLIGKDQKQHLELARNIAHRFNFLHGKFFNIPDSYIPNKYSCKIMALLNPTIKMSKTDVNHNNVIFLLDNKKSVFNKINKSVTDSENKIFYNSDTKPGISNLLNIYASLKRQNIHEVEKIFKKTSYKDFKYLLACMISNKLSVLQEKFHYFRNNLPYLKNILDYGAYQAKKIAQKTIENIYNLLGL
ncbi:tryptophan--tRNA ligase [Buchnera aphidicola]|uniref:tryptophan--tRNA ligase n=1 Tax=Buchnera aphidicola TaxID=9 RepID=UPI003464BA7B